MTAERQGATGAHPRRSLVEDAERALASLDRLPREAAELVEALVAELRRTDEELHEANAKYRTLVEQIPAIVYIDVADESMSTAYVSPQIQELLGISPEEYIADPDLWYKHLHPDDKERALATYLAGRDAGEPFTFEYRLLARDGRVVWFRDSAVVVKDGDGRPAFIHGVMLDITEAKRAEEQLAFLAYHDRLTGLPNRAMFEELLDLAVARARRHDLAVAVLLLDLDEFKLVNDSLGHEAGDELLRRVAERLREATRETDLVARQGGDEFLLLLADLETGARAPLPGDADGAMLIAESVAARIQDALREPFRVAGNEVYVTASIGISLFPHHGGDGAELLRLADAAMFQSKRTGPGGYVVHAPTDADALTKLSLTTRLRRAVEDRNWELHYQPLVDLADGRMVGVEALLRWPDPNGGLVPPGDFIPLAEEMGLIEAIGDWVVEELCRQDRRWREEGLDLEISFNLSTRELWRPELADRIAARLAASGTPPEKVVVEVTESAAMVDPDRTRQILLGLRERGLRIALDDFGSGYSSLSRLRDLPVQVLKIDRSFVRDCHADLTKASMVRAIVALAEGLGMVPLAEGIETEEEWRFLVAHGCTFGQGYLFSRPAPAAELSALARRAGLRLVGGEAS